MQYANEGPNPAEQSNFLTRLYKHAPWWIISAGFTLTILAITSLIYFTEERKKQQSGAGSEMKMTAVEAKIEAPKEKEIDAEPIPLNEPTENSEPSDNAEPEIFMPNAMISDHNETDNDEDYEMMKGDTKDTNTHFDSSGKNMFDSIGLGSGSGVGRGKYGGAFGGRRNLVARKGRPGGATERTQQAVLDGLKWLARHQSADGSWQPTSFPANCGGGTTCDHTGHENYAVGTTGLALLAYLGAGYNHLSRDSWVDPINNKRYVMGHIVRDGLKYLVDVQHEDGSMGQQIGEFFYNHTVATLALTEAFGLSNNAFIKEPAQNALNFMMRHQTPMPGGTGFLGWRYVPGSGESDTSVTGWAVMALKSAELSGLQIAHSSYDGALNWVRSVTNGKMEVGYLSKEDAGTQVKVPGINDEFANHPALTAVGMCIRTFIEHDPNDPALAKGAELIVKDTPIWDKAAVKGRPYGDGKPIDFYYWYYASLALNQFDGPDSPRKDGKYWKAWNEDLMKALLPNQRKDGCFTGSWDGDDRWGFAGGRLYSTAINTLTLEVYYRYDNAFGSSKRGGVKKGSGGDAKPGEEKG